MSRPRKLGQTVRFVEWCEEERVSVLVSRLTRVSPVIRCNVECKHVCFVVYRVLRSQFDAEFFSRDRRVRDCLVERYRSRVQRLGQSLSIRQSAAASDGVDANGASTGHLADLVNDQYLNRYHGRSSSDDDTNIHGVDDDTLVAIGAFRVGSLKTSRKSGDDGDGDDDAECPICFEMLSDSSADGDGWLVCCGDRRHATHRECIDHWLRQNPTKDRCIYCRAPLAYATWFQSATPTASNSARKRKRNSDVTINPATGKPYVNLHR